MNFEKIKIKYNFDRASKTYDQYCAVQNKICDHALQLLLKHKTQFDLIADFACGTGESTKKINQVIQFAQCFGVDFSNNLLTLAKDKINDVTFILSDFDEPVFDPHSLELVFSNMGLQWSVDLNNTLSILSRYLKENGLMVFSLPLYHNFPEINPDNKIASPTHEAITQCLDSLRLTLIDHSQCAYVETFPDQMTALRSIKNVGARLVKNTGFQFGLSRAHIKDIFLMPNSNTLTYHIGTYIARR